MTRPPKRPKSDEQRELEKRRKAFADKLELIAEYLGEDDFVSAVKGTSRMSRRMNYGSGLCCFAPPSARSAGFTDDTLEICFSLLECFFTELLALGFHQGLETLNKSRHRRL